MIELSDEQVLYSFSADMTSALVVASGATVHIRTQDCFGNQLQGSAGSIDRLDWSRVNPATGPVFIEGAQPGDVLKVSIERIEIDGQATMCTGEAEGVLGDLFHDGLTSIAKPLVNGKLIWGNNIELPCKPMIGVIGVAPADGMSVTCGTPGSHGGNMDTTKIAQGSTLYLPVAQSGALFGCGDLHACMGDGEIGVSGAEVSGYVTARFDILKDRTLANPALIDAESFFTIASASTLDEACDIAVHDMASILEERLSGITREDLVMLMSLCGNVQVCQIVDPQKTARFAMPRNVLSAYGFTW